LPLCGIHESRADTSRDGHAHDEGGTGNLFTGVVTDSDGRVTTVTPGAILSTSATTTAVVPESVSGAPTTRIASSVLDAASSTPIATTIAAASASSSAPSNVVVPTSTPSSALPTYTGGVQGCQIGLFSLAIAQLPLLGVFL
jgi:hypothetical protein